MIKSYLKVPFSIATSWRFRGACYSFPWIAPLALDPYLIMLSVKQGDIKYHFWVFDMTWPQIEPQSYRPLVNTLTIMPMRRFVTFIRAYYSQWGCTRVSQNFCNILMHANLCHIYFVTNATQTVEGIFNSW